MPTSRLEAFSDGVFAIAITILVFGIKAPPANDHLLAGLLALWPSYLAYIISFLLIGLLWANHHIMFEHIEKTDRLLMFISTLLLMDVAFIPFTASVLASAFRAGVGQPVAIALYGVTLVLGGVAYYWLWAHAYSAGLMDDTISAAAVGRMKRRIALAPASYAAGGVIGFFVPVLGVVIFAVLILVYWLPIPRRNEAGVIVERR